MPHCILLTHISFMINANPILNHITSRPHIDPNPHTTYQEAPPHVHIPCTNRLHPIAFKPHPCTNKPHPIYIQAPSHVPIGPPHLHSSPIPCTNRPTPFTFKPRRCTYRPHPMLILTLNTTRSTLIHVFIH